MTGKSKLFAGVVIVVVVAVCVAFGGISLDRAEAKTPKISKSSMSLFLGGTAKLKVKNVSKKAKITYKSSKKSVVKVSKKGKLTAKKVGKAKITVKVKTGKKTKKLFCNVTAKKAIIAVLDSGAPKEQAVAKALTVTDAPARGPKSGHAYNQINRMKKEAPKADIVSIRVTDSNGDIWGSCVDDAVNLAIENKATVIYYSFYFARPTEEELAAVKRAVAAGIKIVGPAGNDYGADAREVAWLTNFKGATCVGAYGDNGIQKKSNIHANIYIKCSTTSGAAARYAGMLAVGRVYDAYYK